MIEREQLAQEYISIVKNYYPVAQKNLGCCLVKTLNLNAQNIYKNLYYLGIYYPEQIGDRLLEQQDILKESAENIGLVEVVFVNANHLVKDPLSKIKQQDFRFWLELCWIADEAN